MKRSEQIEATAEEKYKPDWHQGIDDNLGWRMGFIFGAEWADANPLVRNGEWRYPLAIHDECQAKLAIAVEVLELVINAPFGANCKFESKVALEKIKDAE